MRSTLSIDVEAPAHLVFDLARDVTRWPALLPHYLDVRVLERHATPPGAITARMVALRLLIPLLGYGLPVAWRSRTWAEDPGDGTLRLRFVHRGGATDGMDVTWRIEPAAAGCRVTIEHDFEPPRTAWGELVTRLFVTPIATRTLTTFKAIAEVAAPAAAVPAGRPPRSSRGRAAKRST